MTNSLKDIPFAAPGTEVRAKRTTRHRLAVFRKFIGKSLRGLSTLDLGPPNTFGEALGIQECTGDADLNQIELKPAAYDLILASEVIEHVMNLGRVMHEIYWALKPGGICIVSTPLSTWYTGLFYQSPLHFVEYRADKLRIFFEYMGFEVVKYQKYRVTDWEFFFYGFRPVLRTLFQRNQLWMLRRPG